MNNYNPHDLLPIKHPSLEEHKDDKLYFYNNVIHPLIPDVIKMEAAGIPIDLNAVSELEVILTDILKEVRNKLRNNKLILEFLQKENEKCRQSKIAVLKTKRKTIKDFIKPFVITNKIHRTYVVNHYLFSILKKPEMILEEWSIKDLKKVAQITGSPFLENLSCKKIESWMELDITQGMYLLAEYKQETYNKNKIDTKIDSLQEENLIDTFNPGSSVQIQNLFKYLGIESDSKTPTGNPKWNRDELERLQKLILSILDEKEV